MIAEGDKLAYITTDTGTHAGPMGDIPPTERGSSLRRAWMASEDPFEGHTARASAGAPKKERST